jgi:hypothetical protein
MEPGYINGCPYTPARPGAGWGGGEERMIGTAHLLTLVPMFLDFQMLETMCLGLFGIIKYIVSL